MKVKSLGYVVISTRDLAAWADFAGEVMGLMPVPSQSEDVLLFRMDDRPFRVRVEKSEQEGFRLAGWEFESKAAFEAAIERLRAAGREVEICDAALAKDRQVTELARSTDPAGYEFEIYYGRVLDYAVFRSPAGITGFVTGQSGEMGVGHVVLSDFNFDGLHDFYREVLGFGDTDLGHFFLGGGGPEDPGVKFAFLHADNARHHSLAIGGLPRLDPGLVHMMVEVETVDDVGLALERAQKAGHTISASLGRHVNDKMISFYVRSPSGFDIEYGCHGLLIDPETWIPTTSLPVSYWGHAFARPE
ncbi:MAG: hypothetical protein DI556_22040 [Rhodovulum sulfidophilum]|uniref:VOC domain-containing protein n=1 Tax=Rhodovulum sulfidophilum TaxID=35806 RepID=A0A2W5MXA2_RHOSU|nr:MAG: hypothetical protein DI556_22040 [Rhodovulum sulfidophilum]